ncbi:peptidylprolyl isomerase [Phaeovulum sp.]|uniref:peptidylprolyl isomerase n=1 Tax=Phaeovulum sp. TaxID=2934796 RepID=UPI00272FA6EF|nr:peptidylprolyl isomerase [Phaeovulum sp.]MDP1669788.1 peptidylprolyl isomerase [Phaeovulum sp.]MDZ4119076.1 peptidylprolyl isomerase [Phaeovulum sp.]
MRVFFWLFTFLALIAPAVPAAAQGNPFRPVVLVNDLGVTGFEIEQRKRFLALLHAPGNLDEEAEKVLIAERVQMQAARAAGMVLSREQVKLAMEEFASRADMTADQLLVELANAEIEPQTLRDFVEAGATWRELVRARFAGRVSVSEAEIDHALSPLSDRGRGTRVLFSEIVIPAPPGQEPQAMAIAEQVSTLHGEAAFAEAARSVSAAGSRTEGGRLEWMALDTLPAPLRAVLEPLAPGEVSQPVTLQGAVAVFLLRAIDENGHVATLPQAIDYAQFLIPGGQSAEALAEAARVRAKVNRCGDLYGVAKGLPEARLLRETRPQGAIPAELARELARLDTGEISTNLTRDGNLVVLMLCNRERVLPAGTAAPTRREVANALINARLAAYAEGYLADLLAAAIIRRP